MKKNRINLIPLVLAFGLGTGASSLAVSVVVPGETGTQYGKNVKLVVEAKIAARASVQQHTGLEQRHTGLATRTAFSNL